MKGPYRSFQDLFCRNAAEGTPTGLRDRLAVVDSARDEAATYGEIDRRASRLASVLRHLGVGLESRVGVFLDQGIERIVAVLAVLRAGGVYVPLDPTYPQDRLEHMLRAAEPTGVLTHSRLAGRLGSGHPLWCLPLADPPDEDAPEEPLPSPPASATAYIIFTSGSAGRPKGVMVSHRSLGWYLAAAGAAYDLGPGDRMPQLAPIGFDFSICEIFLPLAAGATLVLADRTTPAAVDRLLSLAWQQRLTTLFLPTAFWQELALELERDPGRLPPTLRLVSFGGEQVGASFVESWRRLGAPVRLFNGYGPTEATVEVTLCRLDPPGPATRLGEAIRGVRLEIASLSPFGRAESGELWLGGDCLATGYLGAPARTAATFVPDPWSSLPGSRLYRTGDRIRRLADGRLELEGRLDRQWKVRGFRVEPGEIEARLEEHPQVHRAVVVAPRTATGGRRLVAYLRLTRTTELSSGPGRGILGVGDPGLGLKVPDLSQHLARTLPAYLHPNRLEALESLPLDTHGKVDRQLLERRAEESQPRARPSVPGPAPAPSGSAEATLAAIWSEVLGVESVSGADSFFALGGDSILALRVISNARRQGLEISSTDLFETSTLAELVLAARKAGERSSELCGEALGPAPLTPVQQWFFYDSALGELEFFNQSMLWRCPPLDPAGLEHSIGHLLERHDAFRCSFQRRGDGTWQSHYESGAAPSPLIRIDLRALPATHRAIALEAAAGQVQRSVPHTRPPLLRFACFQLGSEDRLLVVAHHLVIDGVSWGILLADLERSYLSARGARSRDPLQRPTPFQAWARRQQQLASSASVVAQLPFWLEQTREQVHLPLDHNPPDASRANTRASTRRVSVGLDPETTEKLLRRAPAAYRTRINDLLLCALVLTLEPWTGRRSLTLDLEGHGREPIAPELDLSRTAGWFTTTFPVTLTLPAKAGNGSDLGSAIRAIKEQLRALPDHGIGYGLLRYLGPGEPLRQEPTPEISFNYLGQLDALFNGSELFSPATEGRGLERTPRGLRDYRLEVDGGVVGGRLWINWHFSENLHHRQTFESLARRFRSRLEALVEHCLEPGIGGPTPSDYPLAEIDSQTLDELCAEAPDLEDLYPLTPMQQGMLFHERMAPEASLYLEQSSWEILGPLVPGLLARAWDHLAARHEVLRSAFGRRRPDLQLVLPASNAPWFHVDWRTLPPARQEVELEAFFAADRRRGVDRPPHWRVLLLELDEGRFRLLWTYHHALVDGWSISRLLDELFSTYHALEQKRAPRPEATLPFRRYIAWLATRDAASGEAFWNRELDGLPPPRPLPGITPRHLEPAGGELGEDLVRILPSSLGDRLESFGREHRLTPATLVQGAWGLLLGRLGEVRDLVVGTTVSGRPEDLPGVERLIGLLIQTVPLRVTWSPGQPTIPWLRALQQRAARGRQHGTVPLSTLQKAAGLGPGERLFESLLVFENYPVESHSLEEDQVRQGLTLRSFRGFSRTGYPLTLGIVPGTRMALGVTFDPDRFERTTVERLLEQLTTLLGSIVTDPESPLEALALLSPAQQHQVLTEWSQPGSSAGASGGEPMGFLPAFYRQVARRPQAPAVIDGQRISTYVALAVGSRHLASCLARRGIGPEHRVALYCNQGVHRIVAMLGVLEAGACLVPLDPTYPSQRLRQMLALAQVDLILTDTEPPDSGIPSLHVDKAVEEASPRAPSIPFSPCIPVSIPAADSASHLLFTSGSTGQPKGVSLSHRSLAWYCATSGRHYRLSAGDRVLQLAAVSFDISLGEIFPTLAHGGALVLGRLEERSRMADFLAALERDRVSVLLPPTAFWHEMAETLTNAPADRLQRLPPSLRLISFGGEAVDDSLLRAWRGRFGSTPELLTGYGPTETTVEATVHAFPPTFSGWPGSPLGRPVAGTRVLVVDPRLRPVPIQSVGEVVIAGPGLARGYLGQPAATAERFVPDPWAGSRSSRPGARLYRTGDLAYRSPPGDLYLVGRRDQQVKIRGIRVEPGEVATALQRQPGISQAAVVSFVGADGDRRLAGFFVDDPGAEDNSEHGGTEVAAILRQLRQELPPALVPALLQRLPKLPWTPAGKIDLAALRQRAEAAPESLGVETGPGESTAEGEVATLVGSLWRQVLGTSDPAVDFFSAGGDSLLALRLIARLEQVFPVEVPLRCLFENPTAGALARVLETRLAESRRDPGSRRTHPVPSIPRSRRQNHPISWFQQPIWTAESLGQAGDAYHASNAWHLRGPLRIEALEAALANLEQRHESLRTIFPQTGGNPRQKVVPARQNPLPRIDLEALPLDRTQLELGRLLERLAGRPFSLPEGPLFRTLLLRLGPSEHVFFHSLHHLVTDGSSESLFYRELGTWYRACSGAAPPPRPLPLHYGDFSRWQRDRLVESESGDGLAFWRRELADLRPVELPLDRPLDDRPRAPALCRRTLSAAGSAALARLGPSESATPLLVFATAAFSWLLRAGTSSPGQISERLRGRRRVLPVLGMPVTHRPEGCEDLIGLFVDTLPLVGDLDPHTGFRTNLRRVRSRFLDALVHRDLPYSALEEALAPPRRPGRSPFVPLLLEMLPARASTPQLPELEATEIPLSGSAGPWELSIDLVPRDDRMHLEADLDSSVLDPVTVERWLGQLDTLLAAAGEHPDRRLDSLPWLDRASRHQLLVEWTGTEVAELGDSVLQEIADRAAEYPDAIAVSDPGSGEALTYRELVASARRLASFLRAEGLEPEEPVAVSTAHGVHTFVHLLGVLTAGGAYLPLDPDGPEAHRQVLLTATGARRILGPERFSPSGTEPALPAPHGAQLAYIIFTSGTSGSPRPAAISHRALAAYTAAARETYAFTRHDRTLQFSALTFDMSVEEIFPTWAAGGTLVLRRSREVPSPAELCAALHRDRVSFLTLPTAFWHPLAPELLHNPEMAPASLRRLVIGGEQASAPLLEAWRESDLPPLHDTYGPTEATVVATTESPRPSRSLPGAIGRPWPGVSTRVLDAALHSLPIGGVGQLGLSGEQLARGYLGRPAATARRFVPDPHGPAGSRLYLTGDRVRLAPDGRLQFLGRVDRQIKVRGHRIEPGEVERALRSHPEIHDVAVGSGPPGSGSLVAWFIAGNGTPRPDQEAPASDRLRSFLLDRLPAHLVPTVWIGLDRWPLTAHGKIDHGALPRPDGSHLPVAMGEPPRSPRERAVARVWRQILGLPRLGRHDDFFSLGGDSILAIQVATRLRRAGLHIGPGDLLRHPTVARLAEAALSETPRPMAFDSPADEEAIPLTPIQHWFFGWPLEQRHHFNQSYLLRVLEPVRFDELDRAVRALCTRHEALRLRFETTATATAWQQRLLPTDGGVRPTRIDLRGLPRERHRQALEAAAQQAQASLELASGPLLRPVLFELDSLPPGRGPEQRLLLVIHHLAVDGVSWPILLEDLEILLRPESEPSLQPATTGYRTWCQGLQAASRSDELLAQIPYWREVLSEPRSTLPADDPEPAPGTALRVTDRLPPAATRRLLRGRRNLAGIRTEEVLLTALARVFHGWTGSTNLLLELEGHGREDLVPGADLTRSVGWFTATFPVRLELGPTTDLGQQLASISRGLRTIPWRGAGFGLLRYLSPGSPVIDSLRRLPPPQVSFNYLGQTDSALAGSRRFATATESAGEEQGDEGRLCHWIDINARISGGRLVADWSFDREWLHPETVRRLSRSFLQEIQTLLAAGSTAEPSLVAAHDEGVTQTPAPRQGRS